MKEVHKPTFSVMRSVIDDDVGSLVFCVLSELGRQLCTESPECTTQVSALLAPHSPFTNVFQGMESDYLQMKYFKNNFDFVVSVKMLHTSLHTHRSYSSSLLFSLLMQEPQEITLDSHEEGEGHHDIHSSPEAASKAAKG